MKAIILTLLAFNVLSVGATESISLQKFIAGDNSTVDYKAKRFLGDYSIQENCELGDKGTPVKIRFYHNQVKGEASASYLNIEAHGEKVSGVDIPAAGGWTFNEGNFYGDFAHYELNHADWVTFGSNERLVVEQRLHLFLKKELIKNYYKIESQGKGQVKIEAHYSNVKGSHDVLCDLRIKNNSSCYKKAT